VLIDPLLVTTASERDRRFEDGLSYIDNNLDVNNITIKNFWYSDDRRRLNRNWVNSEHCWHFKCTVQSTSHDQLHMANVSS
jgi:hypothetical protein